MRPESHAPDLSTRRRSLSGYSAGMALYALAVVALYPVFKHSTSLDNLIKSDSTAAALFGVTGKISSTGGSLNANLYANFFPLVTLLLTVGYGAACLAGQDEDGTLGLIATPPLLVAPSWCKKPPPWRSKPAPPASWWPCACSSGVRDLRGSLALAPVCRFQGQPRNSLVA